MTPHELAHAYPADWQIGHSVLTLRLYETFKIGAEAVTLTIYTRSSGLAVEVGYRGHVVGEITRTTSDRLVYTIAEKIAHMIAMHPSVVNLDKIPPWARAATALALKEHESRLQDARTHLEWSAT